MRTCSIKLIKSSFNKTTRTIVLRKLILYYVRYEFTKLQVVEGIVIFGRQTEQGMWSSRRLASSKDDFLRENAGRSGGTNSTRFFTEEMDLFFLASYWLLLPIFGIRELETAAKPKCNAQYLVQYCILNPTS